MRNLVIPLWLISVVVLLPFVSIAGCSSHSDEDYYYADYGEDNEVRQFPQERFDAARSLKIEARALYSKAISTTKQQERRAAFREAGTKLATARDTLQQLRREFPELKYHFIEVELQDVMQELYAVNKDSDTGGY